MKNPNDKRFTSAEMRKQADMCEKDLDDEFRSAAMLRQAADVQDDNTRLSTELRWAQDENLAKDEKARIIQSRIDNAERKVMDLRKELYKFGPKELYDMTAVILDALKGRGTAK